MVDVQPAEQAILGAILMDSDAIYRCGQLKTSDFALSANRLIFGTMHKMAMAGEPIDLVSVVTSLDKLPEFSKVGAAGYCSSLLDGLPDNPHLENYVRVVRDAAQRRQLLMLCEATTHQCEDESETTEACVSVAVDRILSLAGSLNQNKSVKVSEYSFPIYTQLRTLARTPLSDLPVGLPTGIPGIDQITTGLRDGEMWTVATYTGDGKTVLVTQMTVANLRYGNPVLVFTQEMSKKQFLLRIIPQITNGVVKGRHLRDPRHMNGAQLMEFDRSQKVIDDWPLWVNDSSSQEITALYSHALTMVRQHKIKMIVVDYIQLVKGRGHTRYEQVSDVSNALRELAKASGVPVVVVSQLARVEGREKRVPRIFDLKESGSIENDSHVILLPYRPQNKEGQYTGDDLIIVGKQREGPTGTVKVKFDSSTLTFQSEAGDGYELQQAF